MYRGQGYKDKFLDSPWSPYTHPVARDEWLRWHAEHPDAGDQERRQFYRDLERQYNRCPGCGAHHSEPLRGWCLVEDVELVEGPHALWDGHFWAPCPVCNAGAWRPTPTASLILNGRIPAVKRQRKVAPAASPARATNGAPRAQKTDSSHCSTKGAPRQLAALVFYRCVTGDLKAVRPQPMDDSPGVKSAYRLVKLYSDGETTPIADDQIDAAIAFVTAHYQCRDFGYWLNDAQALVWATLPQDFERAWGAPTLRCACRYTRQSARYERKAYISRLVRVGSQGYIAPTRTGREVVELRGRFPTFSGDALWAPVEVMEAERQQEEELARRLAGAPHFAGRQAREARQEASLSWPYGK